MYACMLSVEPVEGRGSQQAGKRERKKEKEKRKIVKHTWAEREDTTLTAKLTIYVLSHLLLDATSKNSKNEPPKTIVGLEILPWQVVLIFFF
jgi:hypothetical protein